MSKYFKVSVSRYETTEIYIKGGDSMTALGAMKHPDLGKAALETTDGIDWDKFGWEEEIEANGCVEVTEEEANQFQVYDAEEAK